MKRNVSGFKIADDVQQCKQVYSCAHRMFATIDPYSRCRFISLTLSTFFCCIFFFFCTFESHTIKASSVCDFMQLKMNQYQFHLAFVQIFAIFRLTLISLASEKKETLLQTKAVVESRELKREKDTQEIWCFNGDRLKLYLCINACIQMIQINTKKLPLEAEMKRVHSH